MIQSSRKLVTYSYIYIRHQHGYGRGEGLYQEVHKTITIIKYKIKINEHIKKDDS